MVSKIVDEIGFLMLGKESQGSLADEAVCKQSTACPTRFTSILLLGYRVHQQTIMKNVKQESELKDHSFVDLKSNARARYARVRRCI